ncbi:5090_t:CDS:10 [Diversispora eburnea]|uniref:5090_t:CDS:1 n=1 Tax=Diversispora eburnea TaxID=1213867 RepID=A0A9N9BI95_9GLOM|nr:5090_t:CDS:10 [Diversispora eburnea]
MSTHSHFGIFVLNKFEVNNKFCSERRIKSIRFTIQYSDVSVTTPGYGLTLNQSVINLNDITFKFVLNPRLDVIFTCWNTEKLGNDAMIEKVRARLQDERKNRFTMKFVVGSLSMMLFFLSGAPPIDNMINIGCPFRTNDVVGALLIFVNANSIKLNQNQAIESIEFEMNNESKSLLFNDIKETNPILLRLISQEYSILNVSFKIRYFKYIKIIRECVKTAIDLRKGNDGKYWKALLEEGSVEVIHQFNNGPITGKISLKISINTIIYLKNNIPDTVIPQPIRIPPGTTEMSLPRSSLTQSDYSSSSRQILSSTSLPLSDYSSSSRPEILPSPPSEDERSNASSQSSIADTCTIVAGKYMIDPSVDLIELKNQNKFRNLVINGRHINNGKLVVIKIFNNKIHYDYETKFLKELKSSHVVEWEDGESSHLGYVSITAHHGHTLESEIERVDNDPLKIKMTLRDIARAVYYVHSKGIVHLDLKPSNIIIGQKKWLDIRLADFESARKADTLIKTGNDTFLYSMGYSAPEILWESDLSVSYSMDIFSLGCLFYFLFTKRKIYDGSEDLKKMLETSKPFDPLLSEIKDAQASRLMSQMLQAKGKDRLALHNLINSNFFAGGPDTAERINGFTKGIEEIKKLIIMIYYIVAWGSFIIKIQRLVLVTPLVEKKKKKTPTVFVILPKVNESNESRIPPIKEWGHDTFKLHLLCEGLNCSETNLPPHETNHGGYTIAEPNTFFRLAAGSIATSIALIQVASSYQNIDLNGFTIAKMFWKKSKSTLNKFKQLKTIIDENMDDKIHIDTRDNGPFQRELEKILGEIDKKNKLGNLHWVCMKESNEIRWICEECHSFAKKNDLIL